MTLPSSRPLTIQHDVPLAPFTTIGLGGNAAWFASCRSTNDLREALTFARDHRLRTHLLGGGSNVIFSDRGFNGLVIRMETKGMEFSDTGDTMEASVAAGEVWDDVVQRCVERGFAGVECLSGIPGLVGATPIQNVGAYGQEVCQTIVRVKAIEKTTMQEVEFSNAECRFGYRQSMFKSSDGKRFVVTGVTFRLMKHMQPAIRYPELQKLLAASPSWAALPPGREKLLGVREEVVALRKGKSMVLNPSDSHSRSVGSFFTNPVLTGEQWTDLQSRYARAGETGNIPSFPSPGGTKVPAAWLVEKAGFQKGHVFGNVGVSLRHALALVNYGGTTEELLELAGRIEKAVKDRFGIVLEKEPVIVPFE